MNGHKYMAIQLCYLHRQQLSIYTHYRPIIASYHAMYTLCEVVYIDKHLLRKSFRLQMAAKGKLCRIYQGAREQEMRQHCVIKGQLWQFAILTHLSLIRTAYALQQLAFRKWNLLTEKLHFMLRYYDDTWNLNFNVNLNKTYSTKILFWQNTCCTKSNNSSQYSKYIRRP